MLQSAGVGQFCSVTIWRIELVYFCGGIRLKQSESLKTWGIVFVLLIFAGLASAVVPLIVDELGAGSSETESENADEATAIILDVENMLLGDELMQITLIAEQINGRSLEVWQALAIISGIVLIAVGSLGLILTLVAIILSRMISTVYADEGFQKAQSELEKKQQALLKERQQNQPAVERDEPEARARGAAYVFSFIFLLFVWIVGLVLGANTLDGGTLQIGTFSLSASTLLNIVLVLVTLLALVLAARRQGAARLFSGKTENMPVNWGIIWVIVSGLLIVGLGTGAAIALTSG